MDFFIQNSIYFLYIMINRFFNIIIDTTLNLLDTSKCMNFKLQSNNPLNPNRSGFYIGINFSPNGK